MQFDVEHALAQVFHPSAAPFHHRHGAVHGVFEVDVVDFGRTLQPVGVDVHQVRAAGSRPVRQVGMDADQDERGGNDPGPHTEALAESLGECCFAGPEFAREDDKVACLENGPEGGGQGVGFDGGLHRQGQFPVRGAHRGVTLPAERRPR